MNIKITLISFCLFFGICDANFDGIRLKVITVATEETDGFLRFKRSLDLYGLDVDVFGLNQEWLGGDMANGPGGAHKINLLRNGIEKYKDDENLILMFTDSYDVIFTGGKDEILKKYKESNANILISAEDFCWPDRSLAKKYPQVEEGYKYLCSGGIIGPAPALYKLLTFRKIQNHEDDQLYYTQIYLEHRDEYNVKLDNKAELFQNLHGNEDHVELRFDGPDAKVVNRKYGTSPLMIHGNGPSKLLLDHFGNYIAKSWNFAEGCKACKENTFVLKDIKQENWPTVLIGLFVPSPTPFVSSFLEHISNLDYPKHKVHIFLHSIEPHHDQHILPWKKQHEHEYKSFTYKDPHSFLNDKEGRNLGIAHCRKVKCDYYFSVDADVSLTNKMTLQNLIEQNRTFLTPMISKIGKLWSNFWGAIGPDGFYIRSPDYIDVVKSVRLGVWNSPFVSNIYLIKASTIDKMVVNPFFSVSLDPDMTFSRNARDRGIFMYVTNMEGFGHLKETSTYTTNFKHNDLYQLFDNRLDWEARYLHPEYPLYLDKNGPIKEPCPDVYWWPFVTSNYTREMIEECEHFGQWSGGKHEDVRISGGYENVPTVDIHMNQIGFEKHWLRMLKDYVAPMAAKIYTGYGSESHAIMNFVVKYTPTGQYFLRPHHDASTFTINMALNTKDVDYEGGGARFIRYNCSVRDTQPGWALMHPGRLTHQHEGLETTSGRRYIMVSFIDP